MGGRGAGPPLPYLCTAGLRRRRDGGSRPRSGSELRADGGAKRGGRSLPSTTSNLKFRKGSEERRPSFTSTLTFCMYDSRVTGGETEAQRGEVTGTGHSDRNGRSLTGIPVSWTLERSQHHPHLCLPIWPSSLSPFILQSLQDCRVLLQTLTHSRAFTSRSGRGEVVQAPRAGESGGKISRKILPEWREVARGWNGVGA